MIEFRRVTAHFVGRGGAVALNFSVLLCSCCDNNCCGVMGNSLHSRILVLGIDGAGKTTFINKIEHPNQNIAVTPTEAYKVHDIKIKGVKFNVWDVAGKESTRSLWKHYFQQGGTDAIIWVVDSASSDEKLAESQKCLSSAMMEPALSGKRATYTCQFLFSFRPGRQSK